MLTIYNIGKASLKTLNLTLLVTIGAAFSSCSIGPDYKRPDLELDESFNKENIAEAVDASQKSNKTKDVPDYVWWQGFKDRELEQLIELAVDQNKSIGQALARVNQSRALARQSLTQLFPGATLNGSYEESRASAARFPFGGTGYNFKVYTGSVDASWEIDLFGRLRRDLEANNSDYAAGVYNLQDELRILISDLASTYIQYRGAQIRKAVAEKNVALQAKTLSLIETKYNLGAASELDLQRAKLQLAQTKSSIPTLEASVKINLHRLAILCGEQPTNFYEIFKPIDQLPEYLGELTISSPEKLLKQRPDVRRAENNLAAETARIGVAYGELFPKITLRGSLGVQAANRFSRLESGADTHSFGPSISWGILNISRILAQVKYAEQRTEESVRVYEATVLKALEETENSLVNFSKQNETFFELQNAFNASSSAFKIAEFQYNEGQLDFLSVLDVQRSLLQAETSLYQSQEDKLLALIGIYKALGSGWESRESLTSEFH